MKPIEMFASLDVPGHTSNDVINKAELVAAHHGDFKLYSQLDADENGAVTVSE